MKKFKEHLIIAGLTGVLSFGFSERKNLPYIVKNPCSLYYSFHGIDMDLQRKLAKNGYEPDIGEILNESDFYFLKNVSKINYSNLVDKENLECIVMENLMNKQHTYRTHKRFVNYDESSKQIEKCNIVQLLKLHTSLRSLENKGLCKEIGRQIEEDLCDVYHEHGGVVKLEENFKFIFKPYLSAIHGNKKYRFSKKALKDAWKGSFAKYHFHAVEEDDSKYAGPSWPDLKSFFSEWEYDEGCTEFVITKIKGKNFNVDICFKDYTAKKNLEIVIDLGNYSY